jgi:hypothetical protein
LSQELREADRHHDGAVQALWHHLQGYLADPKTPPALAQDATDLLARLLPHGRSIAGKSYLDEAHNAQRLAPEVEAARAKLETFPIASTAGAPGTLYEVALRVVQAGLQLDALLKQRAAHQAAQTTTHEPAQHLAARSQAQGYLGRLREVVREEAKYRPELPPNLEGRLFAYLDLVASTRQPTP